MYISFYVHRTQNGKTTLRRVSFLYKIKDCCVVIFWCSDGEANFLLVCYRMIHNLTFGETKWGKHNTCGYQHNAHSLPAHNSYLQYERFLFFFTCYMIYFSLEEKLICWREDYYFYLPNMYSLFSEFSSVEMIACPRCFSF